MEGKVKSLVVVIVAVIMVLTIIGTLASTVNNAAEDVTQDDRCATAGCFWNESRTTDCTAFNVTSGDTNDCGTALANVAYPLESLFNTGGIVILLFIAAGLVLIVGVVMKIAKKK